MAVGDSALQDASLFNGVDGETLNDKLTKFRDSFLSKYDDVSSTINFNLYRLELVGSASIARNKDISYKLRALWQMIEYTCMYTNGYNVLKFLVSNDIIQVNSFEVITESVIAVTDLLFDKKYFTSSFTEITKLPLQKYTRKYRYFVASRVMEDYLDAFIRYYQFVSEGDFDSTSTIVHMAQYTNQNVILTTIQHYPKVLKYYLENHQYGESYLGRRRQMFREGSAGLTKSGDPQMRWPCYLYCFEIVTETEEDTTLRPPEDFLLCSFLEYIKLRKMNETIAHSDKIPFSEYICFYYFPLVTCYCHDNDYKFLNWFPLLCLLLSVYDLNQISTKEDFLKSLEEVGGEDAEDVNSAKKLTPSQTPEKRNAASNKRKGAGGGKSRSKDKVSSEKWSSVLTTAYKVLLKHRKNDDGSVRSCDADEEKLWSTLLDVVHDSGETELCEVFNMESFKQGDINFSEVNVPADGQEEYTYHCGEFKEAVDDEMQDDEADENISCE